MPQCRRDNSTTSCGIKDGERCGHLIKTTLVDYPGRIATSFFLRGCNLRCPFCHNKVLVTGDGLDESELSTVEELFAHLEKRRAVIHALVLSGGEPVTHPAMFSIIRRSKSLGLLVKVDANGIRPDLLEDMMADDSTRPDFIAMDMKTSPARYGELTREHLMGQPLPNVDYPVLLRRSVEIVSRLPAECREWRTVLVPGLVGEADIDNIAALLPPDASWQFAHFQQGSCIDSSYDSIAPMSNDEEARLVLHAKGLIKGAALR